MQDISGKELNIGDVVAFNHPSYKRLTTGKIVKILNKSVKIEYFNIIYQELMTTSENNLNVSKICS